MEGLIKVAASKLGLKEIPGHLHNPTIVKFAKDVGINWINDDETPWCSVFMNWVAKTAGFEMTGSARAKSWLDAGIEITEPEPGDVVIYWRGDRPSDPQGHVGLFMGYSQDKKRIYTLGGNQGNAVSISGYENARLLGFRRLRKKDEFRLKRVRLELGDKGRNVSALQDALKLLGFKPGTSDGDFGPKTDTALRAYQESKGDLVVDGIFGGNTWKSMNADLAKLNPE